MSAIAEMSHVGGHRLFEEAQRKSLEISRNPTDHNVGAVGAFVGGVAAACAVGVAIVHAPPAIAPILHIIDPRPDDHVRSRQEHPGITAN